MTTVETEKIIEFVAREVTVQPSDLVDEFGMTIQAASIRLQRMAEMGYFDREREGQRSYYTIRAMNLKFRGTAKAVLKRLIEIMQKNNDPDLKLISESQGGTNPGGGYTYHWKKLLSKLQSLSEDDINFVLQGDDEDV